MNDPWRTDAEWIEEEGVKWSPVHPRGKLCMAQSGISQEIFEKNGNRASVFLSKELPNIAHRYDRVYAGVGAHIVQVKLNPVVLQLTDTFQTLDYREREYHIEVILQVNHPPRFAETYYRGGDPIYTAQKAIQLRVKEYAERTEDRQIDQSIMRHHIECALNGPEYQFLGIAPPRIVECNLSLSTQEQKIRETQDKNDIQVVDAEGQEKVEDIHSDGKRRRKAKDEIGEIYIEQVKKKIIHGTAAQEDLDFFFGSSSTGTILPPRPERRRLRAGRREKGEEADPLRSERTSPSASADTTEPAGQPQPVGRSAAIYRDAWLGVSFRLHTLSDEEQADLKLAHNTTFRVLEVNEAGQLAGHLQEGDLILKLADQSAHDIPTLRQIIERLMDDGEDSLSIRFERDEQSYNITVDLQ